MDLKQFQNEVKELFDKISEKRNFKNAKEGEVMEKKIMFDYDYENDSLYIYMSDKKAKESFELDKNPLGNFLLGFFKEFYWLLVQKYFKHPLHRVF